MAKSLKKRLKNEPTPLIEGDRVTFIWKGKVAPSLVGDFTGWDGGDPVVMDESEPGIWTYQITLPIDAYIEYGFLQGENSLLDPFNPRQVSNGVGGYNNFFSMPEYDPLILNKKNKTIPHGEVTTYRVPTDNMIIGEVRGVHLYQPPIDQPVPLMVVWDGQDYLNRMHLNIIVDNLIALGKIQPIAMAFVNHGGQKSRTVEYGCSEGTIGFLMNKVIPLAVKNLSLVNIRKSPGAYAVTGASMGGLMALFTGLRVPRVFGKVLSQSGAFSWGTYDMVVFDLVEQGGSQPLKVWMDVGLYDIPGLLTTNQKMHDRLIIKGYPVEFREYPAGHNYPAWGNEIWRGLEFLFGSK